MSERIAGIVVSSTGLIIVCLDFGDNSVAVAEDVTWNLPIDTPLPEAYRTIYERVLHYIRELRVDQIVIKGTTTNSQGMKIANLKAAELRGVVIAAAAQPGKPIVVTTKASVSRTFGTRKVDAYLADDDFWAQNLSPIKSLRKASREAALIVLATRKP